VCDPVAQQLVGQAEVLNLVQQALVDRVRTGINSGKLPGQAGSLVRLFAGMAAVERASIALDLAGESTLVWDGGATAAAPGIGYIRRQASCLGGGSTEMARNLISERVLGMPREHAPDRGVAFREVKRNAR
jgi:alkylation response protein AidB-like acyl-CoA dehydrogenase